MINPNRDSTIKLLSAENRQSLRDAQAAWSSPEMVALFEEWNLKGEVLRAYKRLRKSGQDPDSALGWALYDWDLVYSGG